MQRLTVFLSICIVGLVLSCSQTKKDKTSPLTDFQAELEILKDENISSEERKKLAKKILSEADKTGIDSLRMETLTSVTKFYMSQNDSLNFRKLNKRRENFAISIKDSVALAKSNWDMGFFFYNKTDYIDSAYYYYNEAEKIFSLKHDDYNVARLLINISSIQQNIKDYMGSEASAYKALELIQKTGKNPYQLYKAYNNLGVANKELKDFNKSLSFFELAEKQLSEEKNKMEQLILWNNMGSVLSELNNHKKAELFFTKALNSDEKLRTGNPELFSVILVNLSQNRLKNRDSIQVAGWLKQALETAEENDNPSGAALSSLGLSDLYLLKNDTLTAINHALNAKSLAEIRQDNRLALIALTKLIEIDKENAQEFAQDYIQLNDSLQHRDILIQNKFAGIRYETNTFKTQSKELSNRLSWVTITASGILLTLGLLFIIFRQRSRNKELMLIQQKHEADEQVYKLVLKQQKKFEEGRISEKKRIARELHDGILGKLFGLQLNLEILNQKEDPESREKRFEYIDQLRGISQEIRTLSHDLDKVDFNQTDFSSLLRDYVEKQNSKKIRFELNIDKEISFDDLDSNVRINLFRIIQEGIQNIHKHSGADRAEINLIKEDRLINLTLEDNGKGADSKKVKSGIGIKNMKSRAKEMNSKLQLIFDDGKNGGTKIILKIPTHE